MLGFLLRRLLLLPPVLIGVSLVAFLCMAAIPGDPATHLAGKYQDPETLDRLRKEFGLDQPLPVQYLKFLEQVVLYQNLGSNRATGRPVSEEIGQYFMATLELAFFAMLIAAAIGIKLGIAAGKNPGSAASAGALAVAYGGISIPIFWLAILATGLFAVTLGWVPAGERFDWAYADPNGFNQRTIWTGIYVIDTVRMGDFYALKNVLHHLVMPSLVLATIPTAIIVRLTRASMIEELDRDYVRTARAKGVAEWRIVNHHALKNAAIPIITTTGAQFGYLLSGAVLTETVFAWPGLGRYIVDAALSQNTAPLIGGVMMMSLIFVMVNLITDVMYAVIDPRVRISTKRGGGNG